MSDEPVTKTTIAAFEFGYQSCKDGDRCMNLFTIESMQAQYEAGYAKRYEEEQQLTNQCEEQEK